jgi:hypothetical protein
MNISIFILKKHRMDRKRKNLKGLYKRDVDWVIFDEQINIRKKVEHKQYTVSPIYISFFVCFSPDNQISLTKLYNYSYYLN